MRLRYWILIASIIILGFIIYFIYAANSIVSTYSSTSSGNNSFSNSINLPSTWKVFSSPNATVYSSGRSALVLAHSTNVIGNATKFASFCASYQKALKSSTGVTINSKGVSECNVQVNSANGVAVETFFFCPNDKLFLLTGNVADDSAMTDFESIKNSFSCPN
ncbi:Uncharacterised protein [uncultured archaeon]|nr:Uncharacterised protein [uncultured archaeon]